jgi:hypothetical protein
MVFHGDLVHFSLQYAVCGADATFFVDDSEAAAMLAQIDDQIRTSHGNKVCHCCSCVNMLQGLSAVNISSFGNSVRKVINEAK